MIRLLREHPVLARQLGLACDVVVTIISFVLAYFLRLSLLNLGYFARAKTPFSDYYILLGWIVIIWFFLFVSLERYTAQRYAVLWEEFKTLAKIVLTGGLILGSGAFLLWWYQLPRPLIILFLLIDFVMLALEKTLIYSLLSVLRSRGYNRKKVLVVGVNKRALNFLDLASKHAGWGLDVVGFVSKKEKEPDCSKLKILGQIEDMSQVLHSYSVDEIIIALPSSDMNLVRFVVNLCEQEGVQARVISDFFGMKVARIKSDEIYGMPVLTFSTVPTQGLQLLIKQILDTVLSAILLILLSPLFLIVAVVIKCTSPGPILYEWKVVGLNKKKFIGYKFRTMVENADELKEKYLAENEMNGPVFKMKNDPRVTPVGRFLRKFSLDELPQLLSILKGEMSFVGPRPPLQSEVEKYENWHRRRLSVKPGLTCLWQINGRNDINDFQDWAKLDLTYIDNWSLWLDFKILLKTIPVVLLGKGAS